MAKKANRRSNLLDHIVNPTSESESQPLQEALPAAPPAPRLEFVPFNTRLTVNNDLRLNRCAFWLPGKTKQELVNDALNYYLSQFPEADKPTPKEH